MEWESDWGQILLAVSVAILVVAWAAISLYERWERRKSLGDKKDHRLDGGGE